MGFNTVALILNDALSHIEGDTDFGQRLGSAVRGWQMRKRDRFATEAAAYSGTGIHCNALKVISQAHADYSQVVIVGRNDGCMASEAKDLDWHALDQMKGCLERHGYKVTKLRMPRALASTSAQDREGGE